MERRIAPQEVGKDDSFFRLVFGGHGEIAMHVPDDHEVYLDGRRLEVDPVTQSASAPIDATLPKSGGLGYFIALAPDGTPAADRSGGSPSMLLAFRRNDVELAGKWMDLPWQASADSAKLAMASGEDLHMNVGAWAIFLGRLPHAKSIRLQGSYVVSATTGAPGDGVVLLNGRQVLRVPAGSPPYQVREFDADISDYAGQFVLMEVLSDNGVRGAAADWLSPRIVVHDGP